MCNGDCVHRVKGHQASAVSLVSGLVRVEGSSQAPMCTLGGNNSQAPSELPLSSLVFTTPVDCSTAALAQRCELRERERRNRRRDGTAGELMEKGEITVSI